MITLKNVLVPTDFGEASETALMYGRDLARTFGATLHVLHVFNNVFSSALAAEGSVPDFSEAQRSAETSARQQLEALVGDDDRRELGAKAILLTSSSPAKATVSYAKEANIDLIVMGTHGRGAMAQLLMGSVAEKVVRLAPCPVLTVRHPEHEFVLPDALQAAARSAGRP